MVRFGGAESDDEGEGLSEEVIQNAIIASECGNLWLLHTAITTVRFSGLHRPMMPNYTEQCSIQGLSWYAAEVCEKRPASICNFRDAFTRC
jgi:hypothetical protein